VTGDPARKREDAVPGDELNISRELEGCLQGSADADELPGEVGEIDLQPTSTEP
jgi:hypothetical protein